MIFRFAIFLIFCASSLGTKQSIPVKKSSPELVLKFIAVSLPALLLSSFYVNYASSKNEALNNEIDESEWRPYQAAQELELRSLKLDRFVDLHFLAVGNSNFKDAKIIFLIDLPMDWQLKVQQNLIAGHLSRVSQTVLLEESTSGEGGCLNGWFQSIHCESWDLQRELAFSSVTQKGASLEQICSDLNIDPSTYNELREYFHRNNISVDKSVVAAIARHRSMIRQIKRLEKSYQKIIVSGKIGNVPHSEFLMPDKRSQNDIAFVTKKILKEIEQIPYVTLIPR